MASLTLADGPVPSLQVVDQAMADRYGAKSLDGSPPAFYISPSATSTRWVLYFKGGGWCVHDVGCAERARTELGSSNKLAPTFEFGDGFVSGSCEANPDFCEANRVVLWYTDGGSFTGNRADPIMVNNTAVWYRGHANLQAIMATLRLEHSLTDATEVIVSGGSAGGLSTYLHADEVRAMVGSSKLTTYKAAPASGFFLNHTSAAPGFPYVYGDNMRYIFYRMNSTEGVPEACRKRVGPGREHECITAAGAWQTIETPIFMMNSAVDSWQMSCILASSPEPVYERAWNCSSLPSPWTCIKKGYHDCPAFNPVVSTMSAYRESFLTAYNAGPTATKPGNGAFIHTCVSHVASQGSAWESISIDGTTFKDAAIAWWRSGPHAPASENTHLPCELKQSKPYQCNPSCGSV